MTQKLLAAFLISLVTSVLVPVSGQAASACGEGPWGLMADKDRAIFFSTEPGSCEVSSLSLTCTPGGDSIAVADNFAAAKVRSAGGKWVDEAGRMQPWVVTLKLASGTGEAQFMATSWANEMQGGALVSAMVEAKADVLEAFRESGSLTLKAYGETHDYQVPAAGLAELQRFFGICR